MNFDQDLEGLVYNGQNVSTAAAKPKSRLRSASSSGLKFKSWKEHWKKERSPGRMATLADIYDALYLESRGREGAAFCVQNTLQKPYKTILVDTRVDFAKNGKVRITNGPLSSPQSQYYKPMPPFSYGVTIEQALGSLDGWHYLRALFNTAQCEKAIQETLEVLDKGHEQMRLLTVSPKMREKYNSFHIAIKLSNDIVTIAHYAIADNIWGDALGVEP